MTWCYAFARSDAPAAWDVLYRLQRDCRAPRRVRIAVYVCLDDRRPMTCYNRPILLEDLIEAQTVAPGRLGRPRANGPGPGVDLAA
jgi:hypothetical protein